MRSKIVEAGKKGKYARLPSKQHHIQPTPHTPKPTAFIHDHLYMDCCTHPSHLVQRGQFLSCGPSPIAYAFPISYRSSTLHADIRVLIMSSWVEDVEGVKKGSWRKRKWRRRGKCYFGGG
ncbi:uncharacterized protein HD556DRAFT_854674 [Suillus plorans]|uniref:Uncharacterized protein n=1 Tax=Suillus plorans TaxID=116603 RepID=A0A9P7AFZ6_9AGAM|nr:uncharacterized protein HD556DRAFT_854674 [Suillus plorans]KAG1788574.1 hypothetical protein HD556DRAFT_854674 [Suillus plorans]